MGTSLPDHISEWLQTWTKPQCWDVASDTRWDYLRQTHPLEAATSGQARKLTHFELQDILARDQQQLEAVTQYVRETAPDLIGLVPVANHMWPGDWGSGQELAERVRTLETELLKRLAGEADSDERFRPAAEVADVFSDIFSGTKAVKAYCQKHDIPTRTPRKQRLLVDVVELWATIHTNEQDPASESIVARYAQLRTERDREK